MAITLAPFHFADRAAAIAELQASGLHFTEVELTADKLTGVPHSHPYSVDIYMLAGVLDLFEPEANRTVRLETGSKAIVAAGTVHAESSPGKFRAAFGVSGDRAPVEAARAAQLA